MTAANIQVALVKRINEALKDFPLKTSYNNSAPFKIFRHKVPEKLNSEFDYSKEGTHKMLYPFCVVKINNGQKTENQGTQDTVIDLYVGVKHEGEEGEGYDDVMACIEAIWGNLNEQPILSGRYLLKYPIDWALDEEDRHPFYFGGLQVTFESTSITNHQGGIIHGKPTY